MRVHAIMHCVVAALLAAVACACLAARLDGAFRFFEGTWRVARIVGYGEVSVSPEAAHSLIGQTVTIGPAQVHIGADECVPDAIHAGMRATAPILLDQYHAGPIDAGVAARTLVLDAGRCGHVFRVGADIVVYEGGAFYRAVRVAHAHEKQ
ncbi:hypothetical protein FAZ95_36125 [Trinickia violacea]|uniref:Uncharacterized protein n=1 Tax=Trinickia violacea TaxID=2571746 RepID=A0A4P8J0D5_9BURK|nr:hypothetical protein [Trinickia violacea]QCP54371.1 hypothetical protein FAZ95_36125 [Trinickia violacea]